MFFGHKDTNLYNVHIVQIVSRHIYDMSFHLPSLDVRLLPQGEKSCTPPPPPHAAAPAAHLHRYRRSCHRRTPPPHPAAVNEP